MEGGREGGLPCPGRLHPWRLPRLAGCSRAKDPGRNNGPMFERREGRMEREDKERGRKGGRDCGYVPARAALGRPISNAPPVHTRAPARNLCVDVCMFDFSVMGVQHLLRLLYKQAKRSGESRQGTRPFYSPLPVPTPPTRSIEPYAARHSKSLPPSLHTHTHCPPSFLHPNSFPSSFRPYTVPT